jgi:transcriptional regulator with XRE-family HTH domain
MEMQINVEIVKAARLKRAWSQEQLADAAGLGVRTIQRVEANGVASNETAKCLAAVFECSIADLIQTNAAPLFWRRWNRQLIFGAASSALFLLVTFFVARAQAGEVMLNVVLGGGEPNPKTFKVITEEGQKAEVHVDEQVRIVLVPMLERNGRILVNAEVYGYDGKEYRLISAPKVLTGDGVDANLEIGMGDGKRLQIRINPKRM